MIHHKGIGVGSWTGFGVGRAGGLRSRRLLRFVFIRNDAPGATIPFFQNGHVFICCVVAVNGCIAIGFGTQCPKMWSFRVKSGSVCEEIETFLAWPSGRVVETAVDVALALPVVLGGLGAVGIGELGESRASSSSSI